ncbi:MAG: hypothetical protein U0570_16230 [Phycisphaerales bacterium]
MIRLAQLLACLLACFCAAAPTPPRVIAWVLQVQQGIDHARQASDLKEQLQAAKASGARIVCVELQGRAWRLDVAQAIGDVLANAEPPAAVFISGDQPGLGLLVAGSRAGAGCWVQTGATFVARPGENQRELAETKEIQAVESRWKKSDGQSGFARWSGLRAALLDPAVGCWMTLGSPIEIGTGPAPAGAAATPLAEPGGRELRLKAADAQALQLCAGQAADVRACLELALERMNLGKPELRETRALGASIAQRRDAAETLLRAADTAMDDAEKPLKTRVESREVAPNRKHEAAAEAQAFLDRAAQALKDLESALLADPEILRLPAPGQADTGQKPGRFETRWRSELQRAKDRLAKQQLRADKLAKA